MHIAEKLDRFLVAGDWAEVNWSCDVEILPYQGSDHFPIILRIQDEKTPDRCPFKFEAMWMKSKGFAEMIEECWKKAPPRKGNKAFIFFKKLQ